MLDLFTFLATLIDPLPPPPYCTGLAISSALIRRAIAGEHCGARLAPWAVAHVSLGVFASYKVG